MVFQGRFVRRRLLKTASNGPELTPVKTVFAWTGSLHVHAHTDAPCTAEQPHINMSGLRHPTELFKLTPRPFIMHHHKNWYNFTTVLLGTP